MKTAEFLVIGLCAGNTPVTDEFPTAINEENVSIWWRHHGNGNQPQPSPPQLAKLCRTFHYNHNRRVSQMRVLMAAFRDPVVYHTTLPQVLYAFEHET